MLTFKTNALYLRLVRGVFCVWIMLLLTACNVTNSIDQEPKLLLSVGSFPGTGSEGLYSLEYFPEQRTFGEYELINKMNGATIGVAAEALKTFYFVEETMNGNVASFNWNAESKEMQAINSLPAEGDHPCYITLNRENTKLALANYTSGNIALYNIDVKTGALLKNPQVVQFSGSGPNVASQTGSHAHWVSWTNSGDNFYAIDLGADRIAGFPVDEDGALGEEYTAYASTAGSGPRHMVIHPINGYGYILNELTSDMDVVIINERGRFELKQKINLLPETFTEHNQAAHIYLSEDGKFLYTSQRGHDSIAVLSIAEDGSVVLKQHIATGGSWPRYFFMLEALDLLMVANERSGNIVVFDRLEDGKLKETGISTEVFKPTYIGSLP